jgi:hypothetical protein
MNMPEYEVPVISISTSLVLIEGDSFKDACKNLLSWVDEDGWYALCEDIHDYPQANIDWARIGDQIKSEIEKDEEVAKSLGSLNDFM